MKRYVPSIFAFGLLVLNYMAIDIHAQSPRAKTHLEAARAAAYEPGQDFTRRHLYSPYIDWLIAAKANIYQELQFRQEIAGKSDFE